MRTGRAIKYVVAEGQQFTHWTVLGVEIRPHNRLVLCRCDCGTERHVRVPDLCMGKSISC
jgi:hypothetical protein